MSTDWAEGLREEERSRVVRISDTTLPTKPCACGSCDYRWSEREGRYADSPRGGGRAGVSRSDSALRGRGGPA